MLCCDDSVLFISVRMFTYFKNSDEESCFTAFSSKNSSKNHLHQRMVGNCFYPWNLCIQPLFHEYALILTSSSRNHEQNYCSGKCCNNHAWNQRWFTIHEFKSMNKHLQTRNIFLPICTSDIFCMCVRINHMLDFLGEP